MMLSVILLSMLMILPFWKSGQASDVWKQLEMRNLNLICKRHYGLWQKVTLILMLEKLNLFCLTNLVLLIRKLMGLSIPKNHLLRCWGCLFLKNWIGAITLSLLLKLPPRKLEPWFVLWSFFFLRVPSISINLPYGLGLIIDVMSGLVLLAATWKCWINYKSGYVGLLVFHLLPLLNPWLIVEIWPDKCFL